MPREHEPNIYSGDELEKETPIEVLDNEKEILFNLTEDEQKLFKEIQLINGLPREKIRHRYTNLESTEKTFDGKESLTEKATMEVIHILQEPEKDSKPLTQKEIQIHLDNLFSENASNSSQSIERIKQWIQEDPKRFNKLEEELTQYLKKGGKISLNTLTLFGEITPIKPLLYFDNKLVHALNQAVVYEGFCPEFIDQLAVLGRLNNKEANFKLHKILDFVLEFMKTMQDPFYDEHLKETYPNLGQYDEYGVGVRGTDDLFMILHRFAEKEKDSTENYLIRQHLNDVFEIIQAFDSEKEGAVHGRAGGASDEIIYTFKNLYASYKHRLKLGVNEGLPVKNPVLPIAPGYYGFYENGQVVSIFAENQKNAKTVEKIEQQYISNNNPEDDYIYEILNRELPDEKMIKELPKRTKHHTKTIGSHKLSDLRDFREHLEKQGRTFFFDINKINLDRENLHPDVLGNILTYNQLYIDKEKGTKDNITEPLSKDDFYELLFPLKNFTEQGAYSYEYLMSLSMRKKIEEDFNLKMEEMSMWEQRNFLAFLERMSINEVKDLQKFKQQFGNDGLKVFLSLEFDQTAGKKIMELSKEISQAHMKGLLSRYNRVVSYAEKNSDKLAEDFEDVGERTTFQNAVFEGLLIRAKDLLLNTHREIIENKGDHLKVVFSTIQQLEKESPKERVVSGFFRQTAELLSNRPPGTVDLALFMKKQEKILTTLKEKNGLGIFLRALSSRGELEPIPEIHWRVDRNSEEYKQRFGFDVNSLLSDLGQSKGKKVLVELGPGSGKSKAERSTLKESERWLDVALADKVYYPLNELVYNIIDWKKIEGNIEEKISASDRQAISEMLYKVIMIKKGQTSQDRFEYDTDRIKRLTDDPNSIRKILREIAPQLKSIKKIPTTISTRDELGNVLYKDKTDISAQKKQSKAFNKALKVLGNTKITDDYLLKKDAYEAIPAFPVGMMIGDFDRIESLKDTQIDLAFGVRSTVYKRGEDYINFLEHIADKLNEDGLYIADGIRDNDGWYYRLAEVAQFSQNIKTKKQAKEIGYDLNISVVLGKGFSGEDYRQEKVPLALVISKGKKYDTLIKDKLEKGYEIVSFEELITSAGVDKYKIAELDATGHTLKQLEQIEVA